MKAATWQAVLLWLSAAWGSGACVEGRVILMEAAVISGTKAAPPALPLRKGKLVRVRWCNNEPSFVGAVPGAQGLLLDQVLAKASAVEKADYFLAPVFYLESGCILMSAHLGSP